jgi:hypothetical protein
MIRWLLAFGCLVGVMLCMSTSRASGLVGSIGDRVWLDTDGDGTQDVSEAGLAGVSLNLTSAGPDSQHGTFDDVSFGSQSSSSTGAYSFGLLPPGKYRLDVNTSTAPNGTVLTTGNDPFDHQLALGEDVTTADFGFAYTGSIGDLVWFDSDEDGVKDAGESGLAGVGINLTEAGPDATFGTGDDIVVPAQTSAGDGSYDFRFLAPGKYRVDVQQSSAPSGTVLTTANDPNDHILSLSEEYNAADFGFVYDGDVSGKTWLDQDGDGTVDAGEPNLSGVDVSLRFAGADATLDTGDDVITSAITDTSGQYGFSQLAPGQYRLDVDQSDAPAGTAVSTGNDPYVFTLAPHGSQATDFGFKFTASIGGRVWHDTDGDATFDTGEVAVTGASVMLADAGADAVLGTADDVSHPSQSTDSQGQYDFTLLPPGSYRIDLDDAALPANKILSTQGDPIDVELAPGQDFDVGDFAFTVPGQKTLDIDPAAVTTFAGNGANADVDGTGTSASFHSSTFSIVANRGNAYIAAQNSIRKVNLATGVVSTFAGNSTTGGCVNSSDPSAVRFTGNKGITTDGVYLYTISSDCITNLNDSVRRTSLATGATTTLASVKTPYDITYAADGFLYVTSAANREVWKVNPSTGAASVWTNFASGSADAITSDQDHVWVSVSSPNVVKKVALASGAVTDVISGFSPRGLESAGTYLYGGWGNRIMRFTKTNGSGIYVAGSGDGGLANGTGTDAWLQGPWDVASDGQSLWIFETTNRVLRKAVDSVPLPSAQSPTATSTLNLPDQSAVMTAGGTGTSTNVDGTGLEASFRDPNSGVVVGDSLYVGTYDAIRKVDLCGRRSRWREYPRSPRTWR